MPGNMRHTLMKLLEVQAEELRQMEEESGITLSGSPHIEGAGDKLENLVCIQSEGQTPEYAVIDTEAELLRLIGGRMMILRRRLDGFPLTLSYENGALQKLILPRSQDTLPIHRIRTLWNVPMVIPYHMPLDVKGIVTDSGKEHPCRTTLLAFDMTGEGHTAVSRWEQFRFLAGIGFTTVDYALLAPDMPPSALWEVLERYRTGAYSPPTDRFIFEYNDLTDTPPKGMEFHITSR